MKKELEQAVEASDINAVLEQIGLGARLDSPNRHGQTALMIAAQHGDTELVRLLIEHAVDLNVTAKYGLSALMLAVVHNHAEVVQQLCDAGAALTITGTGAPGFSGLTALDLAERAGRSQISAIIRSASGRH